MRHCTRGSAISLPRWTRRDVPLPTKRLTVALATALLLSACGGGADDAPVEEGSGAEGEVLGGSISDDMIALDRLQSQSPPLEEQPAPQASDGSDQTDTAGAEDSPQEEAEPAESESDEEG